jgi:hypothetical protein
MNSHEFINHELKFDLYDPYIPIEKEIMSILDDKDGATDNELLEEVHNNVQIGESCDR